MTKELVQFAQMVSDYQYRDMTTIYSESLFAYRYILDLDIIRYISWKPYSAWNSLYCGTDKEYDRRDMMSWSFDKSVANGFAGRKRNGFVLRYDECGLIGFDWAIDVNRLADVLYGWHDIYQVEICRYENEVIIIHPWWDMWRVNKAKGEFLLS